MSIITNISVLLTQFNLLVGINKVNNWFKASDVKRKMQSILLYRKIIRYIAMQHLHLSHLKISVTKDVSIPFYPRDSTCDKQPIKITPFMASY